MKRDVILKIMTDFCMTAVLVILMSYELMGQAVHEWLGLFLFTLFIGHSEIVNHYAPAFVKMLHGMKIHG